MEELDMFFFLFPCSSLQLHSHPITIHPRLIFLSLFLVPFFLNFEYSCPCSFLFFFPSTAGPREVFGRSYVMSFALLLCMCVLLAVFLFLRVCLRYPIVRYEVFVDAVLFCAFGSCGCVHVCRWCGEGLVERELMYVLGLFWLGRCVVRGVFVSLNFAPSPL
ncbi:hypothetical protein M011DRAFT_60631 [Sporormia fimetaria CBS 119925]|uniref:Transmembrane protein n=1 Tax=Sporormia fimetaria CBS 119925 TaxID=1340428 RepID=A0A6A6VCW9_9PLEO|nr:hypothetical protein M011DRAFT_60631 [Sporormia fimetaria CBS 119925]